MLGVAAGGFLTWLVLTFFERKHDRGIDALQSFVFVIVPALMIAVLGWVIRFLDLPESTVIWLTILYFIVPAAMMKYLLELPWKVSAFYGVIVLVSVIVAELAVVYGFAFLAS